MIMNSKQELYTVKGMTCNGCRTGIERDLKAIPEVIDAQVSLENEEATITFSSPLTIVSLQKELKPKFTIAKKIEKQVFVSDLKAPISKWVQLQPLFLIFGYITVASILLNYKEWNGREAMLDFMGLFYIVFSFFKFLDLKGFVTSFKMYDPLAKRIEIYGWVYPFVELTLGILFLMRVEIPIALVITLIILGVTTIGVTRSLLHKQEIQCACLGTALKLPMTEATFIENAIMITMSIILLIPA